MSWFRKPKETIEPAEPEPQIQIRLPEPEDDEPTEEEAAREVFSSLKRTIHQRVISSIDMDVLESLDSEELRSEVRLKAEEICKRHSELLTPQQQARLINEIMEETFGYGPIDSIMQDYEVTDILINGPRQVYVEKRGRLELTEATFHDEEHLVHVLQRIVTAAGRRIDEKCPMVDARLADGSRLNAIIKPLALNGPLVSIRRFGVRPLLVEDLLKFGSLTPEMVEFLAACVKARINMLISGGAGGGKTTLLNCLSRYIPRSERIATIEDAAELMLQQPHVAKMESRPANLEGEGRVTIRDLLRNCLRMRPDRIIIGECRGEEALDMLQAMNTGHEGGLTTIHANSPRDALTRLEMMVGMGGFELPIWIIRRQVASAINIIIQVARLMGGQRKVVKISEVTGIESENVMMHDLFEFVQTGVDEDHHAIGYFRSTGMRPECLNKINASGIELSPELFVPKTLEMSAGGSR